MNMTARDFTHVRPGDRVTRLLAGVVVMPLMVTDVDDDFIWCGKPDGWKFNRKTGIEVDEELGWGPEGTIGSYLLDDAAE